MSELSASLSSFFNDFGTVEVYNKLTFLRSPIWRQTESCTTFEFQIASHRIEFDHRLKIAVAHGKL